MAMPPNDESPYYKDITHNLGHKPMVRAYAEVYSYTHQGWYRVPFEYTIREFVEDEEFGWRLVYYKRRIDYEHIDNNTVRFYGDANQEIRVTLFIDPRKDSWYE